VLEADESRRLRRPAARKKRPQSGGTEAAISIGCRWAHLASGSPLLSNPAILVPIKWDADFFWHALCSTHGYRGIALSGPRSTPPGIIQLGRAGLFGCPDFEERVSLTVASSLNAYCLATTAQSNRRLPNACLKRLQHRQTGARRNAQGCTCGMISLIARWMKDAPNLRRGLLKRSPPGRRRGNDRGCPPTIEARQPDNEAREMLPGRGRNGHHSISLWPLQPASVVMA
jgi:hypothetical protein